MATLTLRCNRSHQHPAALAQRGARTFFASAARGKQRLVILGSGWGGYEVLRAVDKKRWSEFFQLEFTFSLLPGIPIIIFERLN